MLDFFILNHIFFLLKCKFFAVISVEPEGITIQNVGGPDRSISTTDISKCEILVSKRYRNRRLGEYLKELDLTEGRSTGIPTIQNVLENNGSPRASVITDEDRTFVSN